ncbi:ATP-binding protein [Limibacter armeniacum]|uniref:ATP-binding protein n=1 Tax=Limibacter armeniacum TaxID=466084 RepID=UPI002FE59A88
MEIDFLKQNVALVQKTIRSIDESYNLPWDILAELTQNAVDAIRQRGTGQGKIHLEIDAYNKQISIEDNGCGISSSRLPYLLAPFSTDKEWDWETVGEKGVGLTYVIFSCFRFFIVSGDGETSSSGIVRWGNNWKRTREEEFVKVEHEQVDDIRRGTYISLTGVEKETIFDFSFEELKFLLRTRTALGNTARLFGRDLNIKVDFTYFDKRGIKQEERLPFRYLLPTEGMEHMLVDMDEYLRFLQRGDRSDMEKRIKIQGKIIVRKGALSHRGRSVKYWSCVVPMRSVWEKLSNQHGLKQEKSDGQETKWNCQFGSGIQLATKGMPTSIDISHPVSGKDLYWGQTFMLFEDGELRFDIGRKSLSDINPDVFKSLASKLFNDFAKVFKHMPHMDNIEEKAEWSRNQVFREIAAFPDLSNPHSRFLKEPVNQEGTLVGLFFEAIGSGLIKNIAPLMSGYRSRYDLYALKDRHQVVVEFKPVLRRILKDFDNDKKMFDELDVIVCWEVEKADYSSLKRKGISLERIDHERFGKQPLSFEQATHMLLIAYVDPVYVIEMKQVLNL